MEYVGENVIKLDLDEVTRLRMKHVIFDDKRNNTYWAVVNNNGLYFVYKRIREDEPHDNEGIAYTHDLYEILDDIKEFYELDIIPEQIQYLLAEGEIELDHLKEIVGFLERVFYENSYVFDCNMWIDKIKEIMVNFDKC